MEKSKLTPKDIEREYEKIEEKRISGRLYMLFKKRNGEELILVDATDPRNITYVKDNKQYSF